MSEPGYITESDAGTICQALDLSSDSDFSEFVTLVSELTGADLDDPLSPRLLDLFYQYRTCNALTAIAWLLARRDEEVWAEWGHWSGHLVYGSRLSHKVGRPS